MQMMDLNKAIDQFVMANSVHWYGNVLKMALELEVEGQRMKGGPRRLWRR